MTSSRLPSASPQHVSSLDVQELRPNEWHLWDKLFSEAMDPTPYASSTYLRTLSRVLRRPVSVFVVARGGEVVAGVALLERKQLGMRVVTPQPSTAYSALLYSTRTFSSSYPAKNTSEYLAITDAIIAAISPRFRGICLSLPPEIQDVRPWLWENWTATPGYTYRIDLTNELRMNYSVQKHVRKCERAGLVASSEWNPGICWAMLEETRRRQGVAVGLSETEFYEIVADLYSAGMAWMISVHDSHGKPLSTRVQLAAEHSIGVCDWFAGTSPEGFSIGSSSWNVVKIIEECRARNFRIWDMCGANYSNIARFKSEFGGILAHGFAVQSPRPILLSSFHSLWQKAGEAKQRLLANKT